MTENRGGKPEKKDEKDGAKPSRVKVLPAEPKPPERARAEVERDIAEPISLGKLPGFGLVEIRGTGPRKLKTGACFVIEGPADQIDKVAALVAALKE